MPYMVNPHREHSDRVNHHSPCNAEGALCYFATPANDVGETSANGMFIPALPVLPIQAEPDLKVCVLSETLLREY